MRSQRWYYRLVLKLKSSMFIFSLLSSSDIGKNDTKRPKEIKKYQKKLKKPKVRGSAHTHKHTHTHTHTHTH